MHYLQCIISFHNVIVYSVLQRVHNGFIRLLLGLLLQETVSFSAIIYNTHSSKCCNPFTRPVSPRCSKVTSRHHHDHDRRDERRDERHHHDRRDEGRDERHHHDHDRRDERRDGRRDRDRSPRRS